MTAGSAAFSLPCGGTRCFPFHLPPAELHSSSRAGLMERSGDPADFTSVTPAKKCPASSMSSANLGLRLSAYSTAESLVTCPSRRFVASHESSMRDTALSAWSLPHEVCPTPIRKRFVRNPLSSWTPRP